MDDPKQPTLPGLDRTPPREPRRSVPKSGRELRDQAIERAIKHAGEPWRLRALEIIWKTARKYEHLTADDYHRVATAMNLERPPDGRAWGAVVIKARKNGWMSPTGDREKSKRPEVHRGEMKVYKSHIFAEAGTGWEATR